MEKPELYPMNLRPQGHDIISFWLFHTVVKCLEHTGEVPFDAVSINGMVLDENAEKMSKSKGNVVAPDEVLAEYPVDATRYWAAGTSIGDDFPFKEKDLVTGQKLMRKIWNASKLVDQLAPDTVEAPDELDPIDEWMLAELDSTIAFMTDQMNDYGFAKARNRLREQFWHTFCDNYLEIAKQKLDDGRNRSTEYVLQEAHRTYLKLFAPFLVHITEELWHEMYSDTSIHLEDWPEPRGVEADQAAGRAAMDVIHALRRFKTSHQMAPTDELETVEVYGDITGFEDAVQEVMHVHTLQVLDGGPDVEEEITGIDLDYEQVGPEYGGKVGDIEAAVDEGDYTLDGDELHVAGETLAGDEFDVETERTYQGEGEMVETDTVTVIVR